MPAYGNISSKRRAERRFISGQHRRVHQPDLRVVVELAQSYSIRAVHRLAQLMEGSAGKMKVQNPATGDIEEVEVPVPPAVQVRAAEALLERGWGKAPQAIVVKPGDAPPSESLLQLTILERIAHLRAAMNDSAQVVDLEAADHLQLAEPATGEDPRDCI